MCIGCNKTLSEKGVDMMSGTYIGTMSGQGISYSGYLIKMEKSSRQQIRVSCVSMPKVFETTEFIVTMANGTAHSSSTEGHFTYRDGDKALSLQIHASGYFEGRKQ